MAEREKQSKGDMVNKRTRKEREWSFRKREKERKREKAKEGGA
jgi:hypothetical protein